MTAGDRVRFLEDGSRFPELGTVRKVRPTGFVIIEWDFPEKLSSHHTLATAQQLFTIVTGADALPRHDWDCEKDVVDTKCLRCGAAKTDENYIDPCEVMP